MASKDGRQPLKELKNVQAEKNRLPPPALKKAGVSRKSLIGKHSSIPKPPRSNRLQTVRQVKVEQDPPPPSRVSAKPRRTAATSFRQTSRNPLQSDPSRRSAASMNFTHCASTRTGLSARRASQLEELSNLAVPSAATSFDMSSLPQAIGEALKEAMKVRLDEDRRAEVEDIVKKHMNAMSNDSAHTQIAETLKLRSEILNLQVRLQDSEKNTMVEKNRAESTESRVAELRKEIATLQDSQNSKPQLDSVEIDELRNQLNKSVDNVKELENKIEGLEMDVAAKREKLMEYGKRMEEMSSELKEAMFRAERIQTDLSCRESEIRRMKREKEELQSEREELLDKVKKRNISLQEERVVAEGLRTGLERSKRDGEKALLDAEAKLHAYKVEVEPKMASLEKEKNELQKTLNLTTSDLKHRVKELETFKETTALLQNKISNLNCERNGYELKIEALNETCTKASKQINEISEVLRKKTEEIELLEKQARDDAATRRFLHNQIQELKGNIRVFARVRPPSQGEVNKCNSDVSMAQNLFEYTERGQGVTATAPGQEEMSVTGAGPVKRSRYPFKFDRVFDPTSTQEVVFEDISQLVQSALDGYRVCIFAYGQTGSGKTYTMLGNREDGQENLGMIPRSVRQVFDTAKAMEKDDWTFKLKACFLEIYNEVIRDLLTDSKSSPPSRGKESKVKEEQYKIHFNPETRLGAVQDLTVEDVKNERQLHHLIDLSMKRRATAATKANDRSSRSHSVFRLYIDGSNALTGEKRTGILNLIDLAGSERLSQSKAEGDRLRETRNINRSLSALGDVIAALANKDKHIPFRNSKLTHVLQDSLGGESKTLMFVNISHAPESFHESLTSLRFAAKVNSCHVGTAKRSAKVEL